VPDYAAVSVALASCALQQPLSMAREFDLVKTWNNYITHSPILKVRGHHSMHMRGF
jgi:hypothetical protein